MKFSIITLFPQLFDAFANAGVVGRAIGKGIAEIECINPRDFAENSYGCIDKRPFGGGPGMIMMAEPLKKSIIAISNKHLKSNLVVINFSPCGQKLDQTLIEEFISNRSDKDHRHCLICGRYEGIDERFIKKYVDLSISLGDFIVSGGEVAAFVFLDSLIRRLPGVLGNKESGTHDSFMDGMLQYPHYTKPNVFESMEVPAILKSGDHRAIHLWRREKAIDKTILSRPDLIRKYIGLGYFSDAELAYINKRSDWLTRK